MRTYACVYETPWARKEMPEAREQATQDIEHAAARLGIDRERLATAMRLLHTQGGVQHNSVCIDDDGNVICAKCGAHMNEIPA